MVRFSWFFLAFVISGCSSKGESSHFDRYAGQTYTYECKHTTAPCYHLAGQRCVKGYNIVNSIETERTGGVYGRYRAYSITVKCN